MSSYSRFRLKNAQPSDMRSKEIPGSLLHFGIQYHGFSTKIRYDLLSKSGAMWGTSVEFWHRYVIVDRLNLVLRFFSATLFTIRSHLDQSHNQIPQNVRYQNSNLEPLTNVGSCSEAERFLAEIVLESYKCLLF